MAEPFNVYGSVQDHGSRSGVVDLTQGRDNIPAVDFRNAPGGEGSNHAIDPRDPSIVYSAGFYGSLSRTNIETGESTAITPRPPQGQLAYRGQWLAPFIVSPHNPSVLYHGFNVLHRSMDRGDTWERISGDLTYDDSTKYGDIPYQTIFSISESPLRFGLLYVGTDDGRVHVTRDGGANWTEIAMSLPRGRFIAELVASKYDEGTVFMAQNGKREEDHAPLLWKSTDFGQTWTSVVGNIPIGPINVIREDPKNPSILYAGTDIGVYASIDGGATWQALPNGLPSTYVHDLVVHPRDDIMVVATHGRGIYAMDVRPIQQLTPHITQQPVAVLAQSEPAMLGRGRGFGGTRPARIWYWLASAGSATVTIRNGAGEVVRQLDGTGDAGLNSVMWDLRSDAAAAAGGGGRGGRGGFGGGAAAGAYRVEVRQGSNGATGWVQVSR
jgi:hypothetical protein